jgi:hypothetical protein
VENKGIHKLHFSPHITEDQMGGKGEECGAHGMDEDLSGNLKRRYYFEDGTLKRT